MKLENGTKVNSKFEDRGLIKRSYLIDVPETSNSERKDNVLVTLFTVAEEENTEELAQFVAEADWYSQPQKDAPATNFPFKYNISYRKVKLTTFIEKLEVMKSELKNKYRFNSSDEILKARHDVDLLITKLPKKYLYSRKLAHQVVERIVKDFSEKDSFIEYFAFTGFDFQGNLVPKRHYEKVVIGNGTKDYWYKVREMLERENFTKIELDDRFKVQNDVCDSGVWVTTSDARIRLYPHMLKEFRVGLFEDANKFNRHMMEFVMKVKGKFSITYKHQTLIELDGNYSIYEYDSMFAVVKQR